MPSAESPSDKIHSVAEVMPQRDSTEGTVDHLNEAPQFAGFDYASGSSRTVVAFVCPCCGKMSIHRCACAADEVVQFDPSGIVTRAHLCSFRSQIGEEMDVRKMLQAEDLHSLSALKESKTELIKWFAVVTQQVGSQDPAAFANVDLHLATDQMARMQFMVENGLGPEDMALDESS